MVDEATTRPGGQAGQIVFRVTYDLIYRGLATASALLPKRRGNGGGAKPNWVGSCPSRDVMQLHLTVPPGEARQRVLARSPEMLAVWENFDNGTWSWDDFGPVVLDVPTMTVSTEGRAQVVPAAVEEFIKSVVQRRVEPSGPLVDGVT